MSWQGLAWLAAGLCAGAPPTAPVADVQVKVEVAQRRLQGSARYPLPAGLHAFGWHPTLQVGSVRLDGAELPKDARTAQGLRLQLQKPSELAITWRLPLAPLDTTLDHRSALQADRPMAGQGFAWLPASAGWYPQPASGLGGYALTVHATEGVPIAPGAVDRPSAQTHRFSHPHPVGGIDLLIGPWTVQTRSLRTPSGAALELATYFTPAVAALSATYLDAAAAQIADYDTLIGPWPFARFAIVASPLPTGFGMPGMTWLGEGVLRLPFIPATSLRHEVLHNWWGNGVRVDHASGNWSEGLTTLMADFLVKEREGPEAAAAQRLDWVRALLAVPPGEGIALRDFRARTHGRQAAVGYGKAAFLLWMLRERIGPVAWQEGLQGFWQACRHREASWDDLRTSFEQASGQPLAGSFEPWLGSRTLPAPSITRAVASADGLELELHLQQGEPVHDLELPVHLRTQAGDDVQRVRLDARQAVIRLQLASPALGVRLDPALTVLRAPPPAAVPPILRNALLASRPAWQVAAPTGEVADTDTAEDESWRQATADLAAAFFERPATGLAGTGAAETAHDALLLSGPRAALAERVEALGIRAQRPAGLDVASDARVWTARAPGSGATWVVVEADAPATLAAVIRSLPHHGASGWIAFSEGRSVARGAAPFAEPEIPVTRAPEPAVR